MNRDELLQRIQKIKDVATDDEVAHVLEDSLYADFIEHVAKRKDNIGELARLLLTTEDIDFARWCA